MADFTIFPAIDLRFGQVVRLIQGDPARQTTYNHDPEKTARDMLENGAKWLHVINLDGAFGDSSDTNLSALQSIINTANKYSAHVQFGGGLHNLLQIQKAFSIGVDRVILGSLAIKEPMIVRTLLEKYQPEQIAVSLDSIDNKVMISGWQESTGIDIFQLANEFKQMGLQWLVYTDIKRDGLQTGSDFETTVSLYQKTGLNIIASGGVSSLLEIKMLKDKGIAGSIVGKALYEGILNLNDIFSSLTRETN